MQVSNLIDLLKKRKNSINKIVFIDSSGTTNLSYSELYNTSKNLLSNLQELGIKPGDEVVFQFEKNEKFVITYWACILGGFIPVPLHPAVNDELRYKLIKILKYLTNPYIIISNKIKSELNLFISTNKYDEILNIVSDKFISSDEIFLKENDIEPIIYQANENDIAFIQFSSGSTSDPKGVVLTHENLLTNIKAIQNNAEITEKDKTLSWMPLTHDMGLIGFHLVPFFVDIDQIILTTKYFIRNPLMWLKKADEYNATLISSPNFGYSYFLDKFERTKDVKFDLSSIRLIFNGAEPISYELCDKFLSTLEKYGLRKNSMFPVYGLAEASLAVCFPPVDEEIVVRWIDRNQLGVGQKVTVLEKDHTDSIGFIDEGYPVQDCNVKILDENCNEFDENIVGNIYIKGNNVTSKYYNNKTETENKILKNGWLNTGDLGYISNKRLVVTGRAKDIIFINGQNFYSHDLERILENITKIKEREIVAVGISDKKEKQDKLFIFIRYKKSIQDFFELIKKIKKKILIKTGIEVYSILPVSKIPTTTSGKKMRFKLVKDYNNNEFNNIEDEINNLFSEKKHINNNELSETEKIILSKCREIFFNNGISIDDNLIDMGLNSLSLTNLTSIIEEVFHVKIQVSQLFKINTIRELARFIELSDTKEYENMNISEVKEFYPLSFQQRRLYILNQLDPESTAYNIPTVFKLKGKINKIQIEDAFKKVINKHESLRTFFEIINDTPVQKIKNELNFIIEYEEFPENRKIDDVIKESIKPFNLNDSPLIRVKLFFKGNDEYILLIDIHHIIADGVSLGLLVKDLINAYNNKKIDPVKFQYRDYVEWQQSTNGLDKILKQEKFWIKQFENEIPLLNLPYDFPRPPRQSFEGKKILFQLDKNITKAIEKLCKENNVTFYMFFMAVYNIVLSKYSAQEDIVVGTPIANRSHNSHNNIFGLFMNTICIRSQPECNKKFIDFLNEIKRLSLDVIDNQNYPYEELLEKINIKRDLSRNPLFDTMFLYQNMNIEKLTMENVEIEQYSFDPEISKFDLSLTIFENRNNFECEFEYCNKLFIAETINRFTESFKTAIENIMQFPQNKISDIDILDKNERNNILSNFNNTKLNIPLDKKTIHLFEEMVDKYPEKDAVFFKNQKLTYKELNENVIKTAKVLMKNGISSNNKVGILIDRSLEMIIALLAVMKTGSSYIPLDPDYPEIRIKYILNDSSIKVLLTEKEYFDRFINGDYELLDIRECLNSNDLDINLNQVIHSKNDLAYVIYTSGSTGNPKGVEIEHKSLSNFLFSMADKPGFSSSDKLLSVTTLSFDISGLEFYLPLIQGGQLFITSKEEAMSPDLLMKKINNNKITIMQATPATWKLLIDCDWAGNSNLKALCGGEALPETLAFKLINKVGELWNMYGPTETTIWSSIEKINSDEKKVTIGKPIANTEMYILDNNYKLVPIGVVGELYIGGTGVARGYSNNEKLTIERFIDNPFNKIGKIYKTGDLAFFRNDGKIEYIGRTDNQVKIRGFRIELGEIESVLQTHENVKKCVVDSKVINNELVLVAYIQLEFNNEKSIDIKGIKKFINEKLPEYMLPNYYELLSDFPLTPNGKLDRKKLPLPEIANKKMKPMTMINSVEKEIINLWKEVLGHDNINIDNNFFDIGGHSIKLAALHNKIKRKFDSEITLIDLFKLTTIQKQAEYINNENNNDSTKKLINNKISKINDSELTNDIAVIGLSCRFPGAKNYNEFWNNIENGIDSISRFNDDELIKNGITGELLNNKNFVKAWGSVNDVDKFDASFFGFTPREIEIIDPQQRVLMEECFSSLEDAGYSTEKFNGSIGLFAGVGMNTYINYSRGNKPEDLAKNYQFMISNDKDFLSTRIAYKLNLKGPSVTVQTACSTSLVAVHLACQSLIKNECQMALAGGVSIRFPQDLGYVYQEGMILSPDGYCRAFDENAGGTVGGNGAGAVVLKRLDDAVKDKDNIYAVIKGSAINNDGSSKIGYTAPSIEGQAEAIKKAIINSCVPCETINFIEAHGTGTKLGDPIEVEALNLVYRSMTDKQGFCGLGSVKSNIGHLDTAAGIAGLIKTVLSIYNKKLPKTLYFNKLNPKINLEKSPFYINTNLKELKNSNSPIRAGVSSFGIGGTNVHVILEESPSIISKKNKNNNNAQLFIFSAKTEKSLKSILNSYKNQFIKNKNLLADISKTLQVGRNDYEYRKAIIGDSTQTLIKELENDITKIDNTSSKNIAFLFPGQGSQYVNMASEFYKSEHVFKETVDNCCELLKGIINTDFLKILFPDKENVDAENELVKTSNTQPALFIIEYAMTKYLGSIGIKPSIMIGHSIGEYVAAVLSGVLELEDALKIIVKRSNLMQKMETGSMLAVFLNEDEIQKYIDSDIDVAAVNSPGIVILSGRNEKLENLKNRLTKENIIYRDLKTSHAFHSRMMDPMLEEFEEYLNTFNLSIPRIPFISNFTGTYADDSVATSKYWANHLRNTVKFSKGIKEILKVSDILIEVGPGKSLSSHLKYHLSKEDKKISLTTIRHSKENISDTVFIKKAIKKLWLNGVNIDWEIFNKNNDGKRIPLPTYAFDKKRYWIKQSNNIDNELMIQQRNVMKDWFYSPIWKQSNDIKNNVMNPINNKNILLFSSKNDLSSIILDKLKELHNNIVNVSIGQEFTINENEIIINPENLDDYYKLFEHLNKNNLTPEYIIHSWNFNNVQYNKINKENEKENKALSFFSLLNLGKAVYEKINSKKIKLIIISDRLENVIGDEDINPLKSLLKGPVKVIDQEFTNISCKSIDIKINNIANIDNYALRIIDELQYNYDHQFIAYRGNTRWINDFEKIKVSDEHLKKDQLEIVKDGVYFITGGLGDLGLQIVDDLSKNVNAKFILLSRRDFPEKSLWNKYLKNDENDNLSKKIKILSSIEETGSEVIIKKADISDQTKISKIINSCIEKYGKINGLLHAAGVPGNGIIPFKTNDQAKAVLKPKVDGTLVLYRCFKDINLDFFILFSSITSIFGGIGQIDYCSANAFLDAFAQKYSSMEKPIISINWDTWKEIGMAVNSPNQDEYIDESDYSEYQFNHPLIQKKNSDTLNEKYLTYFNKNMWVLNEHWILGSPVVPGTTYLEIAYSIIKNNNPEKWIEFNNVYFMKPLSLEKSDKYIAKTVITRNKENFEFSTSSSDDKTMHVQGKLMLHDKEENIIHNIDEIKNKCNKEEILNPEEKAYLGKISKIGTDNESHDLVEFGARWNNIKWINLGENDGIAKVELDTKFLSDLDLFNIHPALLDCAVAFLRLFKFEGIFLPFSYGKIIIKNKLPQKFYSYIKVNEEEGNKKGILNFDIKLIDENGVEIIDIYKFTMKEIDKNILLRNKISKKNELSKKTNFLSDFQEEQIRNGLQNYEGINVFRYLAKSRLPQIIVSTTKIKSRIKKYQEFRKMGFDFKDSTSSKKAKENLYPRPELENEYISPKLENDKKMANIWQDILGIEKIGIQDDFFNLGGDSLLLVQLHKQLNEEFQSNVSVVDLYKYTTIEALTKFVTSGNKEDKVSISSINNRMNKKKEALLLKRNKMKKNRSLK